MTQSSTKSSLPVRSGNLSRETEELHIFARYVPKVISLHYEIAPEIPESWQEGVALNKTQQFEFMRILTFYARIFFPSSIFEKGRNIKPIEIDREKLITKMIIASENEGEEDFVFRLTITNWNDESRLESFLDDDADIIRLNYLRWVQAIPYNLSPSFSLVESTPEIPKGWDEGVTFNYDHNNPFFKTLYKLITTYLGIKFPLPFGNVKISFEIKKITLDRDTIFIITRFNLNKIEIKYEFMISGWSIKTYSSLYERELSLEQYRIEEKIKKNEVIVNNWVQELRSKLPNFIYLSPSRISKKLPMLPKHWFEGYIFYSQGHDMQLLVRVFKDCFGIKLPKFLLKNKVIVRVSHRSELNASVRLIFTFTKEMIINSHEVTITGWKSLVNLLERTRELKKMDGSEKLHFFKRLTPYMVNVKNVSIKSEKPILMPEKWRNGYRFSSTSEDYKIITSVIRNLRKSAMIPKTLPQMSVRINSISIDRATASCELILENRKMEISLTGFLPVLKPCQVINLPYNYLQNEVIKQTKKEINEDLKRFKLSVPTVVNLNSDIFGFTPNILLRWTPGHKFSHKLNDFNELKDILFNYAGINLPLEFKHSTISITVQHVLESQSIIVFTVSFSNKDIVNSYDFSVCGWHKHSIYRLISDKKTDIIEINRLATKIREAINFEFHLEKQGFSYGLDEKWFRKRELETKEIQTLLTLLQINGNLSSLPQIPIHFELNVKIIGSNKTNDYFDVLMIVKLRKYVAYHSFRVYGWVQFIKKTEIDLQTKNKDLKIVEASKLLDMNYQKFYNAVGEAVSVESIVGKTPVLPMNWVPGYNVEVIGLNSIKVLLEQYGGIIEVPTPNASVEYIYRVHSVNKERTSVLVSVSFSMRNVWRSYEIEIFGFKNKYSYRNDISFFQTTISESIEENILDGEIHNFRQLLSERIELINTEKCIKLPTKWIKGYIFNDRDIRILSSVIKKFSEIIEFPRVISSVESRTEVTKVDHQEGKIELTVILSKGYSNKSFTFEVVNWPSNNDVAFVTKEMEIGDEVHLLKYESRFRHYLPDEITLNLQNSRFSLPNTWIKNYIFNKDDIELFWNIVTSYGQVINRPLELREIVTKYSIKEIDAENGIIKIEIKFFLGILNRSYVSVIQGAESALMAQSSNIIAHHQKTTAEKRLINNYLLKAIETFSRVLPASTSLQTEIQQIPKIPNWWVENYYLKNVDLFWLVWQLTINSRGEIKSIDWKNLRAYYQITKISKQRDSVSIQAIFGKEGVNRHYQFKVNGWTSLQIVQQAQKTSRICHMLFNHTLILDIENQLQSFSIPLEWYLSYQLTNQEKNWLLEIMANNLELVNWPKDFHKDLATMTIYYINKERDEVEIMLTMFFNPLSPVKQLIRIVNWLRPSNQVQLGKELVSVTKSTSLSPKN